jgi:putative PIN family toxin of toxin-antitoxin system
MAIRVVLDTNVLVSACWKTDGLEAQVTGMAIRGEVEACATDAVLAEYREVLQRPKFASIRELAAEKLKAIEAACAHVDSTEPLQLATDEDDNRFLECAVAAGAQYLITGNLRHYPAEAGSCRVVNARMFLTAIAE